MAYRKILLHASALVLACYALACITFFAFADDASPVYSEEPPMEYQDTTTESIGSDPGSLELKTDPEVSDVDTFNPSDVVSVEVHRSVNPVGPGEANGLKKLFLQLIGDYDMVTAEYTYTSTNGYTSKQVTTEPDYAWMITAALFIMVLWSLFRFVGGLANGKR